MKFSTAVFALTAFIANLASAHGFVAGVTVNGVWTPGADPVWYYYTWGEPPPDSAGWRSLNQDNGFVSPSDFGTSNINCHKSATSGNLYVDVNAGDTITFYWNTWPESHKGPIMNYISPCNGECTSMSASSLRWTKISESAIVSGTTWVTDVLIANNFTTSTRIPSSLRAGNYVIRHEIIALHGGQSDNGAQNYPQCLNLRVGGSGSSSPPNGIPGTSLYRRSDPGILFNLYTGYSSYPFPGPSVWSG